MFCGVGWKWDVFVLFTKKRPLFEQFLSFDFVFVDFLFSCCSIEKIQLKKAKLFIRLSGFNWIFCCGFMTSAPRLLQELKGLCWQSFSGVFCFYFLLTVFSCCWMMSF